MADITRSDSVFVVEGRYSDEQIGSGDASCASCFSVYLPRQNRHLSRERLNRNNRKNFIKITAPFESNPWGWPGASRVRVPLP